jgi:hypothetical protein
LLLRGFCASIKDDIENYGCYISHKSIEIVPYSLQIDHFQIFSNAKNRLLMSATTQDDSFFIKSLGFSSTAVNKPLQNKDKKWSGEKMVLLPTLINANSRKSFNINKLLKIRHTNLGFVVIVPSWEKANLYKSENTIVADTNTLNDEISKLRSGQCDKCLVIVNRYDGIDFPDNSCRVLIIDSLPNLGNLADRYEEECRPESDIFNTKLAQKIEQGLGRPVRGEKDYSVIIIIGNDLVKFIRNKTTNKYFSQQTIKQIEIGLEIAKLADDDVSHEKDPFQIIFNTMMQCLKRDEGWKEYYTFEMNNLVTDVNPSKIFDKIQTEHEYENLVLKKDYQKATTLLRKYIDNYYKNDNNEKGWYLQQLARYTYMFNKLESNLIQKSAFGLNNHLLTPKDTINYKKISYISGTQISNIKIFLSKYENIADLHVNIDEILSKLSFGVDANKFESSLQILGKFLGYESQRPDKEIRKGFDNLWCGANKHFELFECKSKVIDNFKSINKHQVGQMNNHIAWFREQYGYNSIANFYMIIPSNEVSSNANFSTKIKIIKKKHLDSLKKNISSFISCLQNFYLSDLTEIQLHDFLDKNQLGLDCINEYYSEEPRFM